MKFSHYKNLTPQSKIPSIIIHGGATNLIHQEIGEDKIKKIREFLSEYTKIGAEKLLKGDSSLDVVCELITYLEDCPLFNAGHGSVKTSRGTFELDASVMESTKFENRYGGVCLTSSIANPILAARSVLEHSPHALLAGAGAEEFYFNLYPHLKSEIINFDLNPSLYRKEYQDQHLGTVGAVVLDSEGNLAAGTSTGGIVGKHPGRISDSAIIGCSSFAQYGLGAFSTTGAGDYFIGASASQRAALSMELGKLNIKMAMDQTLHHIKIGGGLGGMIGIDHNGNTNFSHTTNTLYYAFFQNGLHQTF
jgi:beta-aspartyl-peptidase (threonine type)